VQNFATTVSSQLSIAPTVVVISSIVFTRAETMSSRNASPTPSGSAGLLQSLPSPFACLASFMAFLIQYM
jgi:Na+-transporting NADH:ubiquinone oxidoreductase subunit NqrD